MLRRLVVAVLFAGAWTGAARAQAPYPAQPVAPLPNVSKPPLYKLFHPFESHTCWTHANSDYNFATLRSESQFIFSSSRTFFLEPCYKGGPPALAPCTNGNCFSNR